MHKLISKLLIVLAVLVFLGAAYPVSVQGQVRLDGRVMHMNNWPLGPQVPQIFFRWGGAPCGGTNYNAVIQLTGPANGSIGNSKCNAGGPYFTSDDIAPWLPSGFYRVTLTTPPPPGYDYYSVSHAESGTDVYSSVNAFMDVNFNGAFITHHMNFGFNPVPPEPWPVLASTAYSGAPSVPSGINLNWTDRANSESNYIVNRLTTAGVVLNSWTLPQNSTSFLVSLAGICNNVPYRYQVYGRNNTVGPFDGWISEATFTCYAPVAAPNPLNFACNAAGTQATLSWAAAGGAVSYNVSTPGIGLFNTAGTSLVLNITPGTSYTSTIQSVNTTGFTGPTSTSRSYSCPAPATPPPATPPPPPAIPLPVTGMTYSCNAANTVATVNWNASAGATSYDYRADNQTDIWTGVCPLASGSGGDVCGNQPGISYALGVNPNTPYNFWVHARNSSGGSTATNLAINCVSALAPATPTNPTITEFPDSTVTLQLPTAVQFTWGDVSGETGYRVRIYNGDGTQVGATVTLPANTTSYLDSTISCGSPNRRYQVEAFNGAGASVPAQVQGSCRTVGFSTSATLAVSGSLSGGTVPDIILTGSYNLNDVGGRDATAQLVYDITALTPGAVAGQTVTENRIAKGSQAINDRIAWPFVKTSATDPNVNARSVQVSSRLVSTTGATIAGPVTFNLVWNGADSYLPSPDPTLPPIVNGSKKELSLTAPDFNGIGPGFTDVPNPPTPQTLTVGDDYWVRLQIDGSNYTPAVASSTGNDIMLVLDVTGSMSSKIPFGGSTAGYTTRISAAKKALSKFVDDMQSNDRVGFASFVYCVPKEQRYVSSIPVLWGYEGIDNALGTQVGYSYVHVALDDADSTQKSRIKELLDTNGVSDLVSGGGFCNNKHPGSATDLGGGLSAGLSLLTNLIQNQVRTYPQDQSKYTNSIAGSFTDASKGLTNFRSNVPHYVVVATDGQENIYPLADDPQPLFTQRFGGNTRTAVEYAMPATAANPERKDVKLYTLTIGQQDDVVKNKLIDISKRTNGVFFLGESESQLLNSYTKIAREIHQISSTENIKVNEIINSSNFSIQGLANAPSFRSNFYITKSVLQNGTFVEKDITTALCITYSDCIAENSPGSSYTFNLPIYPINERYNIYFKVKATTASDPLVNGGLVDVDSNSSNIVEPGGIPPRALDNKQVRIANPKSFYTASGGNVYSGGKISSALIDPNEKFVQQSGDFVITSDSAVDVSNGKISPKSPLDRVLYNYTVNSDVDYQLLHGYYQDKIEFVNAPNGRVQLNGSVLNSNNPYYEVDLPSASGNRIYLDAVDINNKKPKVLFVNADVYITDDITVAKDGLSTFVLISTGNIGIAPSVTTVQGIFISAKSIDTVCDKALGFVSDACAPNTTAIGNTLDLEGMFFVNGSSGKLILERAGNTSISNRVAGESFVYRPDFVMSLIDVLGRVGFNWKEVSD